MAKMLGYMITWTTYGTWLQGDERGYVKNGKTLPPNPALFDSNKQNLKKPAVMLSKSHQAIVKNAIYEKSMQLKQYIHALAVIYNHVHLVLGYTPEPIGLIVKHYKMAGQLALRKVGITGRIWTKGFDKRYCFDTQSLNNRIDYVNSHNERKQTTQLAP